MTIRFFIITVAVLAATAAGLLVGWAAASAAAERHAIRRRLDSTAVELASNVTQAILARDSETAGEMLARAASLRGIAAIGVYLPDGTLFSSGGRSPASIPGKITRRHGQNAGLETVRPLTSGDDVAGTLYLLSDRSFLRGTLFRVGGAALLSLLIAAAAALLLQREILAPIRSMSAVALAVTSHQDYTMRARGGSLAEIGELGTRFNAMISDFNARDVDLRQTRWQLEAEVLRRTAELTGVNTLLSAAKKSAEEAAKMNAGLRLRNESILQSAAEGIFGLDEDGVVTFINHAAAEMLGWDPQQLVGKACRPLIHVDEHAAMAGLCPVCIGGTSAQNEISQFGTSTGALLPVEYTSRAMCGEGRSSHGMVVTFRDITERLAIEKMKNEFVSTVSHELRTPLTSIRGALGLLKGGVVGDLHEKAQRMLQIALTNTDRLIRLVNDILDVERAAAGRLELEKTMIAAGDLMTNAAEAMQAMADQAGVRLQVEWSGETICADPDRMMQTLINLISNAIKFSPPGTQITVNANRDSEHVVFSVADQGRGIPPDKLGLVFDRFKQVDSSDARDKGGSGLGLAIVRGIVEAHGGRIWVESTVGAGSTFFVAVPAHLEASSYGKDRA